MYHMLMKFLKLKVIIYIKVLKKYFQLYFLEQMRQLPPVAGKSFEKSLENALHSFREEKSKLKKDIKTVNQDQGDIQTQNGSTYNKSD